MVFWDHLVSSRSWCTPQQKQQHMWAFHCQRWKNTNKHRSALKTRRSLVPSCDGLHTPMSSNLHKSKKGKTHLTVEIVQSNITCIISYFRTLPCVWYCVGNTYIMWHIEHYISLTWTFQDKRNYPKVHSNVCLVYANKRKKLIICVQIREKRIKYVYNQNTYFKRRIIQVFSLVCCHGAL